MLYKDYFRNNCSPISRDYVLSFSQDANTDQDHSERAQNYPIMHKLDQNYTIIQKLEQDYPTYTEYTVQEHSDQLTTFFRCYKPLLHIMH